MTQAGREPRTSERRLKALEKQRQALELRKAGADFRQIAQKLGYAGPSGAHKAVLVAIAESLREPAEAVIELEVARLDKLLMGVWSAACGGDLNAIDRVLQIEGMRCKILGMNAPTKIAPTTPDGKPLVFAWEKLFAPPSRQHEIGDRIKAVAESGTTERNGSGSSGH